VSEFPGGGDLYFLLDRAGALVAYRENVAPWAGVVAFTSEAAAAKFCRDSASEGCEIAAVAAGDDPSLRAIIGQVKSRGIRYLLIDLDYRRGDCIRYEFEGDWFGPSKPHQFRPATH
jgi:hypothetical protein